MHTKVQKFNDFLQVNGLKDVFAVQELHNELETVLYLTYAEVGHQRMPLKLVIDLTGLVFVQILVAERAVKKSNRGRVLEKLNELNDTYKLCKYYVAEDGSITIESCLPTTDELFQADIVKQIIDIMISNLGDEYDSLKKAL